MGMEDGVQAVSESRIIFIADFPYLPALPVVNRLGLDGNLVVCHRRIHHGAHRKFYVEHLWLSVRLILNAPRRFADHQHQENEEHPMVESGHFVSLGGFFLALHASVAPIDLVG